MNRKGLFLIVNRMLPTNYCCKTHAQSYTTRTYSSTANITFSFAFILFLLAAFVFLPLATLSESVDFEF